MTREEIRDKLRVYIDEFSGADRWTDTELNHLIDVAYNKVTSLFLAMDDSYMTKRTTLAVTTTEFQDLPADFIRLKRLANADGDALHRLYNPAQRDDYIGLGYVVTYYFKGSQLGLLDVPPAAATYSLDYVYRPTPLTSDSQSPEIPIFLGHDLIAVEAAIQALAMDEEESNVLTNEARELKRQIVETYSRRNSDFPRIIEGDELLDDLD
jgi:hypothetical protein